MDNGLWNYQNNTGVLHTTVLTRNDVDFLYCPITRCASTWITHRLEVVNNFFRVARDISDDQVPFEQFAHKTKLFIVRDPLERLVSGARTREDFTLDDFLLDAPELFEKLNEDIHTIPMCNWFNGFRDLSNTVYIKFENWDRLDKFLSPYNLEQNPTEPDFIKWDSTKQWRTLENGDRRWSDPWLDAVRENHYTLDKLNEYLQEDYTFLKTVRYYD